MFASFTSFLPSALQLHASPEKANVAPSSDFRPDNDDDDDENTNRTPGQPSVNEFGLVKDQKEKDKKGANEVCQFALVAIAV